MNSTTQRSNSLTEGEIGAMLARMGLLASGDDLVCVPLDGGVSSDIWRVEIGARKYCIKRALAQLKVSQLWEAPIELSPTSAKRTGFGSSRADLSRPQPIAWTSFAMLGPQEVHA